MNERLLNTGFFLAIWQGVIIPEISVLTETLQFISAGFGAFVGFLTTIYWIRKNKQNDE